MKSVASACSLLSLGLWSLSYAAVLIEATKRLRLAQRRFLTKPTSGQKWLIVRPLCGGTRSVEQLARIPRTSETCELLFLAAADDALGQAAAAAAVRLCQIRGQAAQMCVTTPGGPNGKAVQLAQIPAEQLTQRWVLSLDDDVDAASVNLEALQAALQADGILGAVWLPFVAQQETRTWADALAAQVLNCGPHAIQILAVLAPANLTGKVLAYRPSHVAAAGGWWPRSRFYGDDLDLGQALRRAGFGVCALPQHPATTTRLDQTMRQVWQRHQRWARIIVDQKPILVPSYFWLMGGAPLGAAAWLGAWWLMAPLAPTLAWLPPLGILCLLTARLRLLVRLSPGPRRQWPGRLILSIAADALVLATCFAAIVSPGVTWRGRKGRAQK